VGQKNPHHDSPFFPTLQAGGDAVGMRDMEDRQVTDDCDVVRKAGGYPLARAAPLNRFADLGHGLGRDANPGRIGLPSSKGLGM
jgi:hypothetical protein